MATLPGIEIIDSDVKTAPRLDHANRPHDPPGGTRVAQLVAPLHGLDVEKRCEGFRHDCESEDTSGL